MTDDGRWTAGPDEMRQRRMLAGQVDTTLSTNEQETTMQFFGDADRFQLTTYNQSIVRRLLRHDYAEIQWCFVNGPDGRGTRVPDILSYEFEGPPSEEYIEGLQVTLPLGALTIKGSPRSNDNPSSVVYTPDDAKQAAEAFADNGGPDG